MSRAEAAKTCFIPDGVKLLSSAISAAIAAACGAAADVPKNGLKPGVAVITPSAAAISGFWRTSPPVEEKSPGVMGVPSGSKKTRRGPSELKVSTGGLSPASKTPGTPLMFAAATLTAATPHASIAVL
jgi:hypothetical protein